MNTRQITCIILLSITNKMQHYTIFFITANALHVSGGFSAHHRELKTVGKTSGRCTACLLLPLAVAASKLERQTLALSLCLKRHFLLFLITF
jgi:hypothetical protein